MFSRGADGKRSSREPKGSLEIVEPISDHLSRAKITEVRNPSRDPILASDLLYNPAWSPNMREHVAIVGLIDLVGDGKDHTLEFVRNLTRQGVVVDAYLDLKEQTLKNGEGGPGKLTQSTSYLVQGESPQFVDSAAIDTAVGERKMAIHAKLGEIDKQAESLGITKIPVRRFLALIGYKVPRSAFTGDTSTFYLRPPKTSGEAKEPKEKEEPKDDGEEPKKPPKKELPKKEPPKKEKPAPKGKDKPKDENPPKEDAPKDEKPPKEEKGE